MIRLNSSVYAPPEDLPPPPFFATCEYAKTPANAMAVPAKFNGDTGLRKNNTEEAMTTTLFTQLPTECVTGVTCCKIMYETCWYKWNVAPVINTLCIMSANGPARGNAAAWLRLDNSANGKGNHRTQQRHHGKQSDVIIFTPLFPPALKKTFLD